MLSLFLLLSFIIEIFIVQKQQYFFTVQGNFKGPQRLGPLGPGLVGLAVNLPLRTAAQLIKRNTQKLLLSEIRTLALKCQ